MREEILRLLDRKRPGGDCRINHACLVGYDWDAYKKLDVLETTRLTASFRERYLADLPRLTRLVGRRFGAFANRRLRFEIFVLPFPTVQSFRDAFNRAVAS